MLPVFVKTNTEKPIIPRDPSTHMYTLAKVKKKVQATPTSQSNVKNKLGVHVLVPRPVSNLYWNVN